MLIVDVLLLHYIWSTGRVVNTKPDARDVVRRTDIKNCNYEEGNHRYGVKVIERSIT